VQRRRQVQVQPPPVVPEQVVANVGDDEVEAETVVNDPQNQNDIQRQHVCVSTEKKDKFI
jgi:hypothetical protein